MDIFCASQSPSSVTLTTIVDGSGSASSSSSSTTTTTTTTSIQLDGSLGDGGRAIDRYNPIIRDSSRISKSLPPSPQPASLAVSPKPHLQKTNTNSPVIKKPGTKKQSHLKPNDEKLKTKDTVDDNNIKIEAGKYISPAAADSTRYLLSDPLTSMDSKNYLSENIDPALEFVPEHDDNYSSGAFKMDENPTAKSPSASRCPDQVVVLRVSLHCKGCERKMKKHLSKMRGVTSFTIDFAAKKVTVVGDVTPLEVIASISKVKTIAQISTPSSSLLAASSSPIPLPVN